ncbi:c-type cytochrome [Azospirillum sp.]|uniref:c-type cytochrome n=1 Tax=Azospirillum sp. TaxID=34012 RepID=UPI002D441E88|nr:c-type cytochrome [Azospirillum sp.]HYD70821.1 c-type cytochrome [Azospirillum sp.]
MRCAGIAFGLALAALLAAAPALAATNGVGRPGYGKTLAREMCGECHVVAPDQKSGGDPLAPNLVERVQDAGITELALRAYLQTSHPIMPNVRLTVEQTDDIVAYLLSLKGAKR